MWLKRRAKGNKQKRWKTSLATDENQHISCDRLILKPTTVYSDSLPYLIHKGIARNFRDEIADCIFLIKQNRNVGIYHDFESVFLSS